MESVPPPSPAPQAVCAWCFAAAAALTEAPIAFGNGERGRVCQRCADLHAEWAHVGVPLAVCDASMIILRESRRAQRAHQAQQRTFAELAKATIPLLGDLWTEARRTPRKPQMRAAADEAGAAEAGDTAPPEPRPPASVILGPPAPSRTRQCVDCGQTVPGIGGEPLAPGEPAGPGAAFQATQAYNDSGNRCPRCAPYAVLKRAVAQVPDASESGQTRPRPLMRGKRASMTQDTLRRDCAECLGYARALALLSERGMKPTWGAVGAVHKPRQTARAARAWRARHEGATGHPLPRPSAMARLLDAVSKLHAAG